MRFITSILAFTACSVSLAEPVDHGHIDPPPKVIAITDAVNAIGLLSAKDFESKALSDSELDGIRESINEREWISQIDGLKEKLLAGLPIFAGHHESGFIVWIYFSETEVELLSISAPIVNGSQNEAQQMLDSIAKAGGRLVTEIPEVETWIESEILKSCHAWAEVADKGREDMRDEIMRKTVFDDFLFTVWCVPPDLVVFNAVHQ